MSAPIAILGAGAWGTALAIALARDDGPVRLWARRADHAGWLQQSRHNDAYLPGARLPDSVTVTNDLDQATNDASVLLVVTPAQHVAGLLQQLKRGDAPLLLCAKGIERGSGRLLTEVARELAPSRALAVLSGPTFADEVAAGKPTAVTIASDDDPLAASLVARIGSPSFRPYRSPDPIGVEVAGACKNVIAIACGLAIGAGLGENARAALLTRGLAETTRLGLALGGRPETFAGLAGLGDLALTATSPRSRNYALGLALGEGATLDELMRGRSSVVEGAATAGAALLRANRHSVELPIAQAVADIIEGRATIRDAMRGLLARPFKAEG
ncbi:NAD(P)H-dependent glycerol-3-phosphate dehydrogenase [Roseiterribacter gracilis]|uniref:Glycerol-3-phosphate dehydrogenase [NAD(P)+] n=1 Tax=Roseiterribacter gracilis TaxID=2812848 RepID=A0A8S8XH18_9PROT|nr:glycerol-3-phosphate dehydrogenase [NAD(P)+] [Rhodospirillales bacterium TMPK1]